MDMGIYKISLSISIRSILKDIYIDIDKDILENIDIDAGILKNIDINKILYQQGFGISNTPRSAQKV